jgi:hypothetical protein
LDRYTAPVSQRYRHAVSATRFDAVIVPGGGLWDGGQIPPWVANRLDEALRLAEDGYIITLSAGTPYKPPPLDEAGNPVLESVAGAEYLRKRGFPTERVLIENASYDTIGNAYFSRVMHADPAGFQRLCVITSEFHGPRTEAAFRWVFSLPPIHKTYELTFVSVPDVGLTPEVREARHRKERESLKNIAVLQAELDTLPSFHKWLFTKHGAYAIEKHSRQDTDTLLLQTY